jgi:hypothetical protein
MGLHGSPEAAATAAVATCACLRMSWPRGRGGSPSRIRAQMDVDARLALGERKGPTALGQADPIATAVLGLV